MDIDAISSPGGLTNQQAPQELSLKEDFRTIDRTNSSAGSNTPITDKASFGSAVERKTLDYMNTPSPGASDKGGMSQTYDFSKSVLGPAMGGSGDLADMTAQAGGKGEAVDMHA